jgi:hypothetical protein
MSDIYFAWICLMTSVVPSLYMWRLWMPPRARNIPLLVVMFIVVAVGCFILSGDRFSTLETLIRAIGVAVVQQLGAYAVWRYARGAPSRQ